MARCNMSIERCLGVIFLESTAEITFFFPYAVQVEYITIYTTYIVRTSLQGTSINQNNAHTA